MSTTTGKPLTMSVNTATHGRPVYETVEVTDANGRTIHKHELMRVVTHEHNWLKHGQIVQAESAVSANQAASVYYSTHDRHQSAISSKQVEVAETPDTRRAFQIAMARNRLAHVLQTQGLLEIEAASLRAELEQLGAE